MRKELEETSCQESPDPRTDNLFKSKNKHTFHDIYEYTTHTLTYFCLFAPSEAQAIDKTPLSDQDYTHWINKVSYTFYTSHKFCEYV